MQSQATLRQAVEEQLDLILKIQDQRKALKKQNRMLKEEHHKMLAILKKYALEKVDIAINTDQPEPQASIEEVETGGVKLEAKAVNDQYAQVDIDPPSLFNNSKLSSAHELLRQANTSITVGSILCSKCEEKAQNCRQEEPKRVKSNPSGQFSGQIVKMSKEIATLKKQLKDCEAKGKTRDKQLRDMRKCLEVKSEALEKSRKEFNELSLIFNTDKFKSLRALEKEAVQLRARNSVLEEQSRMSTQLKSALEDLSVEYQSYRAERQGKIERLLGELKEKDVKCSELSRQLSRFE